MIDSVFGCPLRGLIMPRNNRSKRVSSFDTSGANRDCWSLQPGSTTTIGTCA